MKYLDILFQIWESITIIIKPQLIAQRNISYIALERNFDLHPGSEYQPGDIFDYHTAQISSAF